jgi:hypothetical protein
MPAAITPDLGGHQHAGNIEFVFQLVKISKLDSREVLRNRV